MERNQANEIILYQPDDTLTLDVRVEDESVWLNRNQIAELFGRDVKTIGKHIANALREELEGIPVVAKFATVQKEGNRIVTRYVEYYNLDVIISVGYHIGASLKDLGKKLVAFSKMEVMTGSELLAGL